MFMDEFEPRAIAIAAPQPAPWLLNEFPGDLEFDAALRTIDAHGASIRGTIDGRKRKGGRAPKWGDADADDGGVYP